MCYINPLIHARVPIEPPFAHGDGGGGDGGMKLLKLAFSYSYLE